MDTNEDKLIERPSIRVDSWLNYFPGLKRAASRIDQRWMIHPSKTNQRIAARQNWTIAINNRPCSNCPKPGIKKLQSAARTLPAEPWPAMLRSYDRIPDRQVHFVTRPSV